MGKQANHVGYQSKILTGLARVEVGKGDLSATENHIDEAIHLATDSAEKNGPSTALLVTGDFRLREVVDKDDLCKLLQIADELKLRLRDFAAAATLLDRALEISRETTDQPLLYFGYLDRGDLFRARYQTCESKECQLDELIQARYNYENARGTALKLGYNFLAEEAQKLIWRVEEQELLVTSQQSAETVPAIEKIPKGVQHLFIVLSLQSSLARGEKWEPLQSVSPI